MTEFLWRPTIGSYFFPDMVPQARADEVSKCEHSSDSYVGMRSIKAEGVPRVGAPATEAGPVARASGHQGGLDDAVGSSTTLLAQGELGGNAGGPATEAAPDASENDDEDRLQANPASAAQTWACDGIEDIVATDAPPQEGVDEAADSEAFLKMRGTHSVEELAGARGSSATNGPEDGKPEYGKHKMLENKPEDGAPEDGKEHEMQEVLEEHEASKASRKTATSTRYNMV